MSQTVQRYSRRLRKRDWRDPFSWFDWFMKARPTVLFRYDTASGRETGAETFTRASTASYRVEANSIASAASGEKRDRHYIGGLGPYLRLEGSRTNKVVQSAALATTWTAANCTPTNAVGTYAGLSFSRVTGIGATSTLYQSVTMTGDGTKSWFFYVKQNGTDAGNLSLIWYDATAPATRQSLLITVSSGGVVTSSAGTVTTYADGVYRVEKTVASVVAANDNRIYMVNNSAGNTIASILLTGVQAEDATFPSSYVPTTTAAVTRAADVLSSAATDIPMAQTGYVKLVSGQPSNFDGSIVFQRGSNAGARLVLSRTNGAASYTLLHNNGTTSVSGTVAATTVVGDTHELRAILNHDGSVQLAISINGAAEVLGTASAANALTTAWGDGNMYVNGDSAGANQGFGAFTKIVRVIGVQSLSTMRSL